MAAIWTHLPRLVLSCRRAGNIAQINRQLSKEGEYCTMQYCNSQILPKTIRHFTRARTGFQQTPINVRRSRRAPEHRKCPNRNPQRPHDEDEKSPVHVATRACVINLPNGIHLPCSLPAFQVPGLLTSFHLLRGFTFRPAARFVLLAGCFVPGVGIAPRLCYRSHEVGEPMHLANPTARIAHPLGNATSSRGPLDFLSLGPKR